MKKSLLPKTFLGLGIFTATFLGYSAVSTAFPAQSLQIAQNNQYSQKLVNDYLNSCKAGARNAGLSAADAAKLCSCMIEEFQSRYSESRFRELNRQAQQGNNPEVFTEVGMSCYARI
ncbi:MAG: hypothetical protein SAJ12_02230 [Jaaginema sp. PMC 1079.18]|nr:hypothetical protein [Jaaginema sp. PMC 1080.18]MEC4849806.1 hypothetical protein [Jaaginema sp. PMC 1079.18]MEC4866888.1 hypothetical protein [Jaaginema sp. PMC 1078.18]